MQFDWNDQREAVFTDRYALKDNGDLVETKVAQMWNRVAGSIAHNASERSEFYDLLEDFRFLPAGRILSGAGSKQHSATFYNCFVLGLNPTDHSHGRDSRDAILNTISKMVEINCRGGGVGINWSILRPNKSNVKGVHGTSTGPIGWMRGADALADQVRQGGSRTAALMFMLNDWHPDIIDFVTSDKFLKANFSVAISDEFMNALSRDASWTLIFPDTHDPAYDLLWDGDINKWKEEGRKIIAKDIKASYLWKSICESARRHGNPGIVFIDRCNQLSNTYYSEKLICTNPCGEQPLPEYGSCNLGSINLVALCSSNGDINKYELTWAIRSAIKFLDNIIDKSPPLYSEIDNLQKLYRRIGLGVMGLADVFLLNKIRYGSPESLSFISDLYSFIRDEAYKWDTILALERGHAPMFSPVFLASRMADNLPDPLIDHISIHGLRNMSILTQAPTGTTSILAGVSSGIEPIFSSEYIREDATGKYMVRHPLFLNSKRTPYQVTAHEITPEEHIEVQAQLQKFIDSSISKTINMPKSTTIEDVDKAYRLGWDKGVKGITVYADGSQGSNILTECPSGRCDI